MIDNSDNFNSLAGFHHAWPPIVGTSQVLNGLVASQAKLIDDLPCIPHTATMLCKFLEQIWLQEQHLTQRRLDSFETKMDTTAVMRRHQQPLDDRMPE